MAGMGRLGAFGSRMGYGTMGLECKPGFYPDPIFKSYCIPSSGTLIEAAGGGVTGAVATGVATSPATQQAAISATGQKFGTTVVNWVTKNPVLAIGAVVLVGAMFTYGTMSFARGR